MNYPSNQISQNNKSLLHKHVRFSYLKLKTT